MATIKVLYRPSLLPDHEGTIYYQILHARKPRQLLTEYHVFQHEWSERRANVDTSQANDRKSFLLGIRERIRWDLERLTQIIREFDEAQIVYTSDTVIEEFNRRASEYTLFNYLEGHISRLKQNGKIRTSETYKAALLSFKKYRNGEDVMLESITSATMESYESWMKGRGNTPNTMSFYLRILRAVYNRAVEDELIQNRHPFRHVYTGVGKTVKRALPIQQIKRIKALDLSLTKGLEFARDMFLMSFYLRGMSFVDMAFLRKSDLKEGYVVYRRRKTGQQLTIAWTKEMQALLDKYPENETVYLLPIITNPAAIERYAYKNAADRINHNLKKVAKRAGVTIPLSMYVARHSWASIAKSKGIPVSVISEGMGHDSESTTQIYLASLDTAVIDDANSLILNSL